MSSGLAPSWLETSLAGPDGVSLRVLLLSSCLRCSSFVHIPHTYIPSPHKLHEQVVADDIGFWDTSNLGATTRGLAQTEVSVTCGGMVATVAHGRWTVGCQGVRSFRSRKVRAHTMKCTYFPRIMFVSFLC